MTLIADNVRVLRQGIELLGDLDADLYAKAEPLVSSGGIGSHVRHVLDYYERFLAGLDEGKVDYDLRTRDELVEKDVCMGLERSRDLERRLEELRARSAPETVRVKMEAHGESAPWSRTSLERELQFLLSHTVHHFALIAVILRLNGIEPVEGFGVAPSTLRYWKETRVCAH